MDIGQRVTDYQELTRAAQEARRGAYAPYSQYAVGAALLASSGTVYLGCNVENCSYGLTMCAERVALFKAVAAGERRFTAIAVVTAGPEIVLPCGACRQTLAEFGLDTVVIASTLQGQQTILKLNALLPLPFVPAQLNETRVDS